MSFELQVSCLHTSSMSFILITATGNIKVCSHVSGMQLAFEELLQSFGLNGYGTSASVLLVYALLQRCN